MEKRMKEGEWRAVVSISLRGDGVCVTWGCVVVGAPDREGGWEVDSGVEGKSEGKSEVERDGEGGTEKEGGRISTHDTPNKTPLSNAKDRIAQGRSNRVSSERKRIG